jgi:hypothetical protein
MTTRWLPSEGGLVASWQRKFQVRRGSVPQRGCRSGYSESPYRLNRYVASCAKWTEAELLERNRLLCQRIARIWPLPWPAEQSGESVAERNANPAPPFKGGWMDLVPLEYCDRTVAGRTMLGFQYKGTSYPTGYWTTMFTKLFKLILEERRADTVAAVGRNVCQNVLALKHKKGLKLLVKKQSIWYMTNAPIPEKLAALRSLFKALGIPLEEVGIYLKPMADRPAAAVQYQKVPLSERSGPASLLVRDAVRLIRNGRCGQAAVSRPEGSVPDDAAPPSPMISIVPEPRKDIGVDVGRLFVLGDGNSGEVFINRPKKAGTCSSHAFTLLSALDPRVLEALHLQPHEGPGKHKGPKGVRLAMRPEKATRIAEHMGWNIRFEGVRLNG